MAGINLLASFLVFWAILCIFYGARFVSNKVSLVSRFTQNNYAASEERVVAVDRKKAKHALPWRMAAPLIMGGGLAMAFVVYCVVGVGWISILSSLAGLLFPKLYVDWLISSSTDNMEKNLEQALETMGTVLRSSGSLPDAFERASMDSKAPLNEYLLDAAIAMRSGTSQADAIRVFQEKVQVKELNTVNVGMRMVKMSIPISMSDVFFDAQESILERISFRRTVKALVAENRMAAWIVGIMPFLLLGGLRQMSPDMLAPLYTTPIGLVVFLTCTTMIFVGIYAVTQISKVDI